MVRTLYIMSCIGIMMSLLIIANLPTGTTHEHYEFSNPLNLDEDELERVISMTHTLKNFNQPSH